MARPVSSAVSGAGRLGMEEAQPQAGQGRCRGEEQGKQGFQHVGPPVCVRPCGPLPESNKKTSGMIIHAKGLAHRFFADGKARRFRAVLLTLPGRATPLWKAD